jgi:carbonic anhydrase/acetyltransferase-like protein (isoleucine patch superfamily)
MPSSGRAARIVRPIRPFRGKWPQIDPSVYVADTSTIIGDVEIGARSSIWFGAVLRGDVFHIRIGSETSIQDNTVIHVTHDRFATTVGNRVTVGHSVVLHGCTVGDLCIIGMGATVLDQVEVGERCIVGAGALLTPGTKVPPGHLVVGAPARVKRPLSDAELEWLAASAAHYVELGRIYCEEESLGPTEPPQP